MEGTWFFWFALDPFADSIMNLLARDDIGFVGLLDASSEHGSAYVGIGNIGHSRFPPEGGCCS